MLINLEEVASDIASKVDGARLTPVIEKEIIHYEIIRSLGRNGLLRDITFQGFALRFAEILRYRG